MRKPLLFMMAAVWMMAMAGPSTTLFTNMNVAYAGTLSTAFVPVADSYVYQSSPSANFGSNTSLRLDGSPLMRSYLRFNVQGVSGSVTSATLRLYANSAASVGISVAGVADSTWTESGINYANAPAPGSVIRVSGNPVAGSWLSVDVTSYITGNGTYNLALLAGSSTQLGFASRESTTLAPQLVINTSTTTTSTPPPTTPPTATPTTMPTATPTGSGTSYQPAFPIRAGFFYPWFPQAWTQSGIFPFTNYHPSLGYYSSTDDTTIDAQLNLIAKAHLTAMISSWWGQGHHTDTAFAYILGRSERVGSPYPNLRWSLYYEAEGSTNPSASQIASDLNYLKANYFDQPGFLKVNGKPVIFVYSDPTDACAMVDRWIQAKAQVSGGVYVVLKVFPGYKLCANQPDSWHQYAPANPYDSQGSYSATVSPGFWKIGNAPLLARNLSTFTTNVRNMVATNANWQLVTTWSEWGEGTAVEPAIEWGTAYVDALCQNIPGSIACTSGNPTPTPTNSPTPAATVLPSATPLPTASPTATPTGSAVALPNFDHIFVLVEENHSSTQIIGSASAPYINGPANQYGLATNYTAIRHPSLPNYLAMIGGDTFGITTDCAPTACPVNAANLADRIEAAGKSWKGYMESMLSVCCTPSKQHGIHQRSPLMMPRQLS